MILSMMMIIIVIVFIIVSSGSCELISTDHCHVCVKELKSLRSVFICLFCCCCCVLASYNTLFKLH